MSATTNVWNVKMVYDSGVVPSRLEGFEVVKEDRKALGTEKPKQLEDILGFVRALNEGTVQEVRDLNRCSWRPGRGCGNVCPALIPQILLGFTIVGLPIMAAWISAPVNKFSKAWGKLCARIKQIFLQEQLRMQNCIDISCGVEYSGPSKDMVMAVKVTLWDAPPAETSAVPSLVSDQNEEPATPGKDEDEGAEEEKEVPLKKWDLEKVLEWLIAEGLAQHCQVFESNHMTGEVLEGMTKEDIKELLPKAPLGDTLILWHKMQELQAKEHKQKEHKKKRRQKKQKKSHQARAAEVAVSRPVPVLTPRPAYVPPRAPFLASSAPAPATAPSNALAKGVAKSAARSAVSEMAGCLC